MMATIFYNDFVLHRLLPISLCIVLGIFLERIARVKVQSTRRNQLLNTSLTILFQLSDYLIGGSILFFAGLMIDRIPHRPLLIQQRPGILFALFLGLLGSVAADFCFYWIHRFEHVSKWLWPLHELHHSDECVNVTTTFRRHWLESPLLQLTTIIPSLFLPEPQVVLSFAYGLGWAQGFIGHFNIPMELGWLNRIMVTPEVHRIHHSILPEHLDRNFAGSWPIWDIVFGTYSHPQPGMHPPTGLISRETVKTLPEALFQPFRRWWNLIGTLQFTKSR